MASIWDSVTKADEAAAKNVAASFGRVLPGAFSTTLPQVAAKVGFVHLPYGVRLGMPVLCVGTGSYRVGIVIKITKTFVHIHYYVPGSGRSYNTKVSADLVYIPATLAADLAELATGQGNASDAAAKTIKANDEAAACKCEKTPQGAIVSVCTTCLNAAAHPYTEPCDTSGMVYCPECGVWMETGRDEHNRDCTIRAAASATISTIREKASARIFRTGNLAEDCEAWAALAFGALV